VGPRLAPLARIKKGGLKMKIGKLVMPLILCLALLATACAKGAEGAGQEGESAPANPKDVTIRFAWWGSQARIDATLAVIDMYQEKTGVTIEAEYMPFDSYFTKFNTLAAAGDLYDVFQLGGGSGQYDEQIEDMQPFIDSGVIEASDIDQSIMDANKYKGKLLGLS
jgi:multiple sugar transport system substrate-binding protein